MVILVFVKGKRNSLIFRFPYSISVYCQGGIRVIDPHIIVIVFIRIYGFHKCHLAGFIVPLWEKNSSLNLFPHKLKKHYAQQSTLLPPFIGNSAAKTSLMNGNCPCMLGLIGENEARPELYKSFRLKPWMHAACTRNS